MQTPYWKYLLPSAIVGSGILASSWIAKEALREGWNSAIAPLVLVLAVIAATSIARSLQGGPTRPPASAWIVSAALMLSFLIMTPSGNAMWAPTIGVAAWAALLNNSRRTGARCSAV